MKCSKYLARFGLHYTLASGRSSSLNGWFRAHRGQKPWVRMPDRLLTYEYPRPAKSHLNLRRSRLPDLFLSSHRSGADHQHPHVHVAGVRTKNDPLLPRPPFGVKTLFCASRFFGGVTPVVKMVSLGRAVFWWETARFIWRLTEPDHFVPQKHLIRVTAEFPGASR